MVMLIIAQQIVTFLPSKTHWVSNLILVYATKTLSNSNANVAVFIAALSYSFININTLVIKIALG